ncbi:MAG: deoxyribose-phosphate aldolase [Bacteroidales bacterium]|nr:deoxyribose-phosphate aldolase [Bacteroidales bacterium]
MTKLYEKLIHDHHSFRGVGAGVEKAASEAAGGSGSELLKSLFSHLDLTTLNSNDNNINVSALAGKVRDLPGVFPGIPNVAAVCVWPNYSGTVSSILAGTGVRTAVVSAAFPSAQSFREVKIIETSMAVEKGADEVDIVMPLGLFMEKKYDMVAAEIRELRDAAGNATLKVIIESGLLSTPENIYTASMIAMDAGADFIKTSTGKAAVSATPEAAWVMSMAIDTFFRETGIRVGLKPAGGIATVSDASLYYSIVRTVLGEDWLKPELFRIGASRLANNLLSDITGIPATWF